MHLALLLRQRMQGHVLENFGRQEWTHHMGIFEAFAAW